jgi:broad specificity phosphatase PhoE
MAAADGGPGVLGVSGMAIGTVDAETSQAGVTPMKSGAIVLARHGEPALSRRVKLDAAGYRDWWAKYEEGGLLAGQTPPELLKRTARDAHVILASTRQRSIETARAVAGDKSVIQDIQFIEAPLPPPNLPAWLKFSPRTWGVIARFWWWVFNHHEGQETKAQEKVRARRAAQDLIRMADDGRDVLLLAHGFFNGMIGMELQRLGWRCVKDQGFNYWSVRRFEKR